jgi:phosphoglycolate phosphatase
MPQLIAAGIGYPVQAILFDKDGTLLDFIYTWGNWSEHLLARFSQQLEARGLPPLNKDISSLWGTLHAPDGKIENYDRNGPLAMGTVEELLTVLAWQGYRLGLSWAEAKVIVQDCRFYADKKLDESRAVRALPDVIPFLEQCRSCGMALAVVTADETAAAVKHLEWLGIQHYFAAIIGTDQVERGKPFPDMVELACRKLSIECSQAAVIGDTNGDMRMAKSAGAAVAIGIAEFDSSIEGQLTHADVVIHSYRELVIGEGDL